MGKGVIEAYGQTDITPDAAEDLFNNQIQELTQDDPPHDITIVLYNASVTISADSRDD